MSLTSWAVLATGLSIPVMIIVRSLSHIVRDAWRSLTYRGWHQ